MCSYFHDFSFTFSTVAVQFESLLCCLEVFLLGSFMLFQGFVPVSRYIAVVILSPQKLGQVAAMDQIASDIYVREPSFSTFGCFQFGDTMEQVVTIWYRLVQFFKLHQELWCLLKSPSVKILPLNYMKNFFHTLTSIPICVIIIILCFCVCF